jgi:aminoglycoside phosphotransferase (APT) family kinase protein
MSAPEPAPAPWLAGVDVSAGQAAGLIRAQFPELAAATVTRLATGWDNTAFVVDDRWLFRFPRREIAVPGVRRELAVLPRLAPALPLPIPDPRFAGHPARDYPWPFFGAALLPGTELADAGLPDEQRVAAATGIGRFLAVLHDPALAARLGAGLPVDPMRRASAVLRARRAREILVRLAARGTWPGDPAVTALVDRGEALAGRDGDVPPGPDLPGGAEPVICHGDLHVRHVLVDSAGAASGVIDWGDLCLGDPVIDLSVAYLGFAGPARAALLAAYGRPLSPDQELAARLLAVSLGATLAEYAADDDRPALLRESLAGLRRAASG